MDVLDNELLAQLRVDGRAPVAKLAAILGVSRATVQNRIDKLQQQGVIKGFTIRVTESLDSNLVKAIMMLEIANRSIEPIIQRLRGITAIRTIHSTNGAWDLVLEVQTQNLAQFDQVLQQVRQIKGVSRSETSILLSSL